MGEHMPTIERIATQLPGLKQGGDPALIVYWVLKSLRDGDVLPNGRVVTDGLQVLDLKCTDGGSERWRKERMKNPD